MFNTNSNYILITQTPLSQVYRLSTYPLPHLNLPHLLFNLAFFLPLCSSTERHTGTLPLAVVLCTVCTFLPALLYCAAMLGLGVLGTGTAAFIERDVVVGISGWVFAMVVGELAEETRNGGERRWVRLFVCLFFLSKNNCYLGERKKGRMRISSNPMYRMILDLPL